MALTPKDSPYVLGIDLGTSNSAIAVYVQHGDRSESRIIPVDSDKDICPSVVYGGVEGEFAVGRKARKRILIDPNNTVISIKREMGSDWKKEFKGFPGKEFTPVDISTQILNKLIEDATSQSTIDLKGTPKDAVICIPANFNDIQKKATKEAGENANLNVLKLLEEPVAAAIAYGMEKERAQTILVYDLGGGTFDVSILQIKSIQSERSKFKILDKEGIEKLGGDDFDYKIMEMAAVKLEAESELNLLDLKKDQGVSTKKIREAQQKLKEAAETAKCELSEVQTTHISLPNLITDESGTSHNLDIEITRDQFNDAIRELIAQSRKSMETALESAHMTIEDISRIIMVGGSTRIPLVKEMLTDFFNKEPYSDTNPDTAIARGAAIFASSLRLPADIEEPDQKGSTKPEIEIQNTVTHFLGIGTLGNNSRILGIWLDPPTKITRSICLG